MVMMMTILLVIVIVAVIIRIIWKTQITVTIIAKNILMRK